MNFAADRHGRDQPRPHPCARRGGVRVGSRIICLEMCGIAGLWDPSVSVPGEELERIVSGMTAALRHRGPDDHGTWVDAAAGVALGHRRLSILDLSPTGHQPMTSSDGRWVLDYNGEIYNFASLRRELEALGVSFRGTSDTEVAVEAVARWGVEPSVRKFVGMFAFALWDRHQRELWLVRDRIGIKPLYYGRVRSTVVFASEMKAVCALDGFRPILDPQMLPLFLRYGYIPSPFSAFQGMHVLPPGSLLRLCGGSRDADAVPQRYWSFFGEGMGAGREHFTGEAEFDDRVEDALREAVRLRMVADVPVGAFLSGGIDSSLTVALMQQVSRRPVRTFTVGFHEAGYDEAPHAAAVARYLGTEHTEVYLSEQEAMEVVPQLPTVWDEPFADSSQIPTLLVSQIARRAVTVALSGDGGDELFGGYTRYQVVDRHWRWAARFGRSRRLVARGLRSLAAPQGALLQRVMMPLMRLAGKPWSGIPERLLWRARLLEGGALPEFYHRHSASVLNPRVSEVTGDPRADDLLALTREPDTILSPVERMMFIDTLRYLPDDILTKVDRASMAVSLETRVPLLDHRLVELAWQIPFARRVGAGAGKATLRRILARHVQPVLFERPKMGFGLPHGEWLRGGLRDWAEALLDTHELEASGWLDAAYVRARWQEHLDATADHRNLLWAVLMLQAWRQRWRVT